MHQKSDLIGTWSGWSQKFNVGKRQNHPIKSLANITFYKFKNLKWAKLIFEKNLDAIFKKIKKSRGHFALSNSMWLRPWPCSILITDVIFSEG